MFSPFCATANCPLPQEGGNCACDKILGKLPLNLLINCRRLNCKINLFLDSSRLARPAKNKNQKKYWES